MIRQIILIAALFPGFVNAQIVAGDSLRNIHYGLELNQFVTGSGYSPGTELLVSVTEGKRSFHVGFYYCTDVRRITGIIAHHEVWLLRNPYRRVLQPFAFYNGIARITKLEDIDEINTAGISPGIYKTFEHHIGLGIRTKLSRSIYFSGSAGYGLYFGSVKKPVVLEGMNEIAGSNGFAPLVKLGFGLIL